jgi:hypothetical protein
VVFRVDVTCEFHYEQTWCTTVRPRIVRRRVYSAEKIRPGGSQTTSLVTFGRFGFVTYHLKEIDMKIDWFPGLLGLVLIGGFPAAAMGADIPVSEATAECLDCHASVHPGVVEDWQSSRHAAITPQQAMAVKGAGRKISSAAIPENLQKVAVGCAECHTLRAKEHADTLEHNGYDVHSVVSPKDCATCHSEEVQQYGQNIMSRAHGNLAENKVYQALQVSIIGQSRRNKEQLTLEPANALTKADACYYCHGTRLAVTGKEIRDTELAGELEFAVISGWPNQGVGRINLDGSRGSCTACHTRHAFSIEMARKPYTCKECHVGPDVPAFPIYAASKHGNIFSSRNRDWNFNTVPWTVGKDFSAPTCATCHVSLLVNTDEEVLAPRTHRMNDRLPWRIYGLIYAHPHPQSADTTIIRNKDGLPLPTDFNGAPASKYLIDEKQMKVRTESMQKICLGCHATSWVQGHWQKFENSIQQTNHEIRTATGLIQDVWKNGFATGLDRGSNPFDEGQFHPFHFGHGRGRGLRGVCRRAVSDVPVNRRTPGMVQSPAAAAEE